MIQCLGNLYRHPISTHFQHHMSTILIPRTIGTHRLCCTGVASLRMSSTRCHPRPLTASITPWGRGIFPILLIHRWRRQSTRGHAPTDYEFEPVTTNIFFARQLFECCMHGCSKFHLRRILRPAHLFWDHVLHAHSIINGFCSGWPKGSERMHRLPNMLSNLTFLWCHLRGEPLLQPCCHRSAFRKYRGALRMLFQVMRPIADMWVTPLMVMSYGRRQDDLRGKESECRRWRAATYSKKITGKLRVRILNHWNTQGCVYELAVGRALRLAASSRRVSPTALSFGHLQLSLGTNTHFSGFRGVLTTRSWRSFVKMQRMMAESSGHCTNCYPKPRIQHLRRDTPSSSPTLKPQK